MDIYIDCRWFGLHLVRANSPRPPGMPWHSFDWTSDFGGFGRTGPYETAFSNHAGARARARALREAEETHEDQREEHDDENAHEEHEDGEEEHGDWGDARKARDDDTRGMILEVGNLTLAWGRY